MSVEGAQLLAWYDANARALPWRAPPGAPPMDPYRVWLSEVMLQQTVVATVIRYFERFTGLWPDVRALAAAPREAVLAEWAGLGYYARARNLHACAEVVARDHEGRFPDTVEGLRALPGIGPYTADAIAAIAFGRDVTPLDGNIERVTARLRAIRTPLPAAKPEMKAAADAMRPAERPGDFAQALMDLGATVCIPKSPRCGACPLARGCAGRAAGIAADLPVKAPKRAKPTRRSVVFVHFDEAGRVLVETRPDKGLLGGMLGLPGPDWTEPYAPPPFLADWRAAGGEARHVFTHFALHLRIMVARGAPRPGARYLPIPEARAAMPTVFRKALDLAARGSGA